MATKLVGRILTKVYALWVKGHAEVSQGQPEVKLLRNTIWLPSLVERTPDQSIVHCWDERSYRSSPGSTRGKIARSLIRWIACLYLLALIWPKSSSYVISEFAICHVVRHSNANSIQNPSTVTVLTMEHYCILLSLTLPCRTTWPIANSIVYKRTTY